MEGLEPLSFKGGESLRGAETHQGGEDMQIPTCEVSIGCPFGLDHRS